MSATTSSGPWKEEKKNLRLIGHSDLGGWGDAFQIQVNRGICYVAAPGENGHNGMTILDVSDPRKPKVIDQIADSPAARTHKVLRINDEVLITNCQTRPNIEDPEVAGGLRIYDIKDITAPVSFRHQAVAGCAGYIVDNCQAGLGQAIEKGAFTYVGSSDQRNDGFCHVDTSGDGRWGGSTQLSKRDFNF